MFLQFVLVVHFTYCFSYYLNMIGSFAIVVSIRYTHAVNCKRRFHKSTVYFCIIYEGRLNNYYLSNILFDQVASLLFLIKGRTPANRS